jgi:hypothetical protein
MDSRKAKTDGKRAIGTASNLQIPKKLDNRASRDVAEAKAKALLARAVGKLQKAEDTKEQESTLETRLASVRKAKVMLYWEAGKFLAQARKFAPHGTWTRLLEDAKLPPVQDHDWRMLYGEFPDPGVIEDVRITEALALAKESRSARKQAIEGPQASKANTKEEVNRSPESRSGGEIFGFRIWSERENEGLPIVHAVRKGQRGWTPQCRVQWDLGLGSEAPPTGVEADVNCPKCVGKLAAFKAEIKLHQEENTPHGSDIGYVWEILDGDNPDDIDARWLPITGKRGKLIVTPEKTFGAGEPVYRDRREALETTKAKYENIVEEDQAEIQRLKAEAARLIQEKRLAEKRVKKIEALLKVEA